MSNVWMRKAAIPLEENENIYKTIVLNDQIHVLTYRGGHQFEWYIKIFDDEQNEWKQVHNTQLSISTEITNWSYNKPIPLSN